MQVRVVDSSSSSSSFFSYFSGSSSFSFSAFFPSSSSSSVSGFLSSSSSSSVFFFFFFSFFFFGFFFFFCFCFFFLRLLLLLPLLLLLLSFCLFFLGCFFVSASRGCIVLYVCVCRGGDRHSGKPAEDESEEVVIPMAATAEKGACNCMCSTQFSILFRFRM